MGQTPTFGPGMASARHVARDDGYGSTRDQSADPRAKSRQRAVGRTRAFGKEDQDTLPSSQQGAAAVQAAESTFAAGEGNGIEQLGREQGREAMAEEVIRGGRRMRARQPAPRDGCHEHDGVEMAGMVGDQHERTVGWQVLDAVNVQAMNEA